MMMVMTESDTLGVIREILGVYVSCRTMVVPAPTYSAKHVRLDFNQSIFLLEREDNSSYLNIHEARIF